MPGHFFLDLIASQIPSFPETLAFLLSFSRSIAATAKWMGSSQLISGISHTDPSSDPLMGLCRLMAWWDQSSPYTQSYLPYLGRTFLGSRSSTVVQDFRTKPTFIRDQVINDIQIQSIFCLYLTGLGNISSPFHKKMYLTNYVLLGMGRQRGKWMNCSLSPHNGLL